MNDNVVQLQDKNGRRVWAARESKAAREGLADGTYTEVTTDAGAPNADSGDRRDTRTSGSGSDNRKRATRTTDGDTDQGVPGPA